MKKSVMAVLSLVIVGMLSACNTLLGPPGSESEVMQSRASATSAQYDLFFEGQPNLSLLNVEGGYYLWRTGNTWHVRVAKPGRYQFESAFSPVYTGKVDVEYGHIFNLHKQDVDLRNDVRLKQNQVVFWFRLKNEVEGFDFSVQPMGVRYCVTFDLKIDDAGNPSNVRLGRNMFIPDRLPLSGCVP